MNEFVLPNPGVNTRDNKLFIFGKRRILVLKIDQHGPRAWTKTIKEPGFRATFIPSSMGTSAVQRLNTVPEHAHMTNWRVKTEMAFLSANVNREIIDAMGKFEKDVYQICALAMRAPGGLDLIQSNQAVAYMVALNNVFMGKCSQPWRRARALCKKRRRDIVEKAGFDRTNASVKILAKITSDLCNSDYLFRLRAVLRKNDQQIKKSLNHLTRINRKVLYILCDHRLRNVCNHGLLEELADPKSPVGYSSSYVEKLLEMSIQLNRPMPRNIRNTEHLREIHDDFIRRLGKTNSKPFFFHFPLPGIRDYLGDSLTIENIRNTEELLRWGNSQCNCIGDYNLMLHRGEVSMFRVKSPEQEATLTIRTGPDGRYEIDQLSATGNGSVESGIEERVLSWLEDGGLKNDS